ncbi:sensor histidine kinase [Bacillus sp. FSL W7-1360]
MTSFMFMVSLMLFIWGLIFTNELTTIDEQATFIFIITGWLILYFLRPLIPVWKAWQLLLIISYTVIHLCLLSPESLYPWLMYYFFLVDVAMNEKGTNKTPIFIALGMIISGVSFIPFILDTVTYPIFFHLCILIVIFCAIIYLRHFKQENEALKDKWTSSSIEYRALKRHAYHSEQNARAEERTRIARDMHDSVGHQLTALMMQLEMTERKTGEKEVNSLVAQAKQMARDSLNETRQAVRALSDQTYGISSVLQLIRKLESESHIRVQLTTKEGALSASLTNEQYVTVYRFVQEGITNAMRHGFSREVTIILEVIGSSSYQMRVENRIHSLTPFEKGFGLIGLTERLESLDGRLDISRSATHFCLTGVFPLKGAIVK